MNVEQCQPQTKATDLGYEYACRLLLSTSTIAIYCIRTWERSLRR